MAFTCDLEHLHIGEISRGFHYPDELSIRLHLYVTVFSPCRHFFNHREEVLSPLVVAPFLHAFIHRGSPQCTQTTGIPTIPALRLKFLPKSFLLIGHHHFTVTP